MAHRRAVPPRRAWGIWLLVPVALALDAVAALNLEGRPFPMGVIVSQAVLLAVPLLVYGTLAFLVLRTWPLGSRLAAVAVLLGIHAGLVALHTVAYIGLWSMPAAAALRLAHRWSPLIPLLQLVWVPLLALPLATLTNRRPLARSHRGAPVAGRKDVPAPRTPHAARARLEPAHEVRVEPGAAGLAPVAAAETVPRVAPEAAPSPLAPARPMTVETSLEMSTALSPVRASRGEPLTSVPAPTWFDGLAEVSAPAGPPALPSGKAVDEAAVGPPVAPIPAPAEAIASCDGQAGMPVVVESIAAGDDEAAISMTTEAIAAAPPSTGETLERELPRAEPPIDLDLVARVFGPYGPLLSRDRAVVVDWAPGPDVAVVCVAPREMSRDHVVRLAIRLAQVLDAREGPSALDPIGRLSLQGSDGVVVLTPLDGAVLVAAARRRGALALLEVLSRRVGRPEGRQEPEDGEPGVAVPASAAGPALVDLRPVLDGPPPGGGDSAVARAVRVATPTAWVDVIAPPGIEAESVGALAGRLVAALADGEAAGAADLHALSVDLPAHRLVIHPVHPYARPPRFVAVVGGPERPGLLGRRAERAARTLREAS